MTKMRHIKRMDRAASALAILAVCAMAWDIAVTNGQHYGPIAIIGLGAYAALVVVRRASAWHELRQRDRLAAARSKGRGDRGAPTQLSPQTVSMIRAVSIASASGLSLRAPTVATSPYLNRRLRELHEVQAG